MTLPYCTQVDVDRKLDLLNQDYRGTAWADRVRAKIQAVSQRWDARTGTPMRTIRVGSPANPRTYSRHDAGSTGPPQVVGLDYGHIVPLDASAGDVLEIRVGRDSWDDVTDERGDAWTLDNEAGQLRLYRRLIRRISFEDPAERFVRVSYRAGGLGGDRRRGGQTELDGAIDDTEETLSVAEAGRLPGPGVYLTVGTPTDQEYIRVTDTDYDAGEIAVARGQRATDAVAHDDGATVLYASLNVREAVAAKVAAELVKDEESEIAIPDDGQVVDRTTKAEQWEADWDDAVGAHASIRVV
jgi:hypothetical protein